MLAIAGCAHGAATDDPPWMEPAAPSVDAQKEAVPFRLGREDVIEVAVYRDPELTRVVAVRPDGRISLPIVGELEAAGRTPDELRALVVERLGPWVKSPAVVSLIVREVNSARFFVVGEVARPGAYPLRSPLGPLEALSLAGGLGEFSSRRELWLLRADGARHRLRLADLERRRAAPVLQPGDTLVVR